MESVYPQNDKIGLVEVPEIKTFFAAQPWSTDLLQIFVKIHSADFTLDLCKVIEKSKNSLIYLSTISIFEISEGK